MAKTKVTGTDGQTEDEKLMAEMTGSQEGTETAGAEDTGASEWDAWTKSVDDRFTALEERLTALETKLQDYDVLDARVQVIEEAFGTDEDGALKTDAINDLRRTTSDLWSFKGGPSDAAPSTDGGRLAVIERMLGIGTAPGEQQKDAGQVLDGEAEQS